MIEKIYEDFTTKLLPKVAEGLVITKDYFVDLFGRYIKYLIVTDIIGVLLGAALLVGGIYLLKKHGKKAVETFGEGYEIWPLFYFLAITPACIVGSIVFFESLDDLAKDIFIPEIRVYEEIKSFGTHE